MNFFSSKPATIEIHHPGGLVQYRIMDSFSWEELHGEDVTMGYQTVGDFIRDLPLATISLNVQGQLEGLTWPSEYRFIVRPTDEYDAVASEQIDSTYPMPVSAIQAAIRGASVNELQAIVDDNGDVLTLMLSTDVGVFLRFSGAWIDLLDPEILDGLDVINVEDTALDIFDPLDQSGQLVSIRTMPVKPEDSDDVVRYTGGSGPTIIGEKATSAEALTAGGVVVISSASDIPAAVELASAHEDMRWYVERRIAALGLEYEVPW